MIEAENLKFSQEPELSREETDLIRDLELYQKYMAKVRGGLLEEKERSQAFVKTAKLLIGGILEKLADFAKEIKEYHDRR
jgi:hypothetical protein